MCHNECGSSLNIAKSKIQFLAGIYTTFHFVMVQWQKWKQLYYSKKAFYQDLRNLKNSKLFFNNFIKIYEVAIT